MPVPSVRLVSRQRPNVTINAKCGLYAIARIMAAIATGISSAFHGCAERSRTRPIAATTIPAKRGDPLQIARDPRFVAIDVIADRGRTGRATSKTIDPIRRNRSPIVCNAFARSCSARRKRSCSSPII